MLGVVVVPTIAAALEHNSIRSSHVSLFPVDPFPGQAAWVTNVNTLWYKSLDMSLYSNSNSNNTVKVHLIPLKEYVKNTPQNISESLVQPPNSVVTTYAPQYNISSVKQYLLAGTRFIYEVCIKEPSEIIDVGAHLFQISSVADLDGYLNYIISGDYSSALKTSNTMITLSHSGCVKIDTVIPEDAHYYAVSSMVLSGSAKSSKTEVLSTMNCSSSMQIRQFDANTNYTCSTQGSKMPCSILLVPPSEAVVNISPKKFAVAVEWVNPNGTTNLKIKLVASKNVSDIILAAGLAMFIVLIITVILLFGIWLYNKRINS